MIETRPVTITAGEFEAFQRAVRRGSRGPWIAGGIVVAAALLNVAVSGALAWDDWTARGSVRPTSLGNAAFGLGLLVLFALARRRRRQLPWRDTPLRGRALVHRFTPEGVEQRADGMAGSYAWSALRGRTREGGLMLLWLGRTVALVVPERGFAPGEADRAWRLADRVPDGRPTRERA